MKYNGKIYSLPSLIFSWTWWDLSNTNNAQFIVDKWENIPYSPNWETLNNTMSISEVLQKLTWTDWLTLTWITIPSLTSDEFKNLTSTSSTLQELQQILWITNQTQLWNVIFWSSYNSNTNVSISNSESNNQIVQAYVSWTPYTKWQSFIYDSNTWYVSNNTKVAYTKSSWVNDIPQNLTSSDLILVFENGSTLTKWTNAFILKTVNQWATTPYIYWTTYTSWKLWNDWVLYNSTSDDRKWFYSTDKSMLWDYYQWWRNDPVSLLNTTTTLYSSTWYQTWWINISWSLFILNSNTPYSWINSTQHNSSSSVAWTDTNNSWPCGSWYRIPTSSDTIWNWEWRKVVEIVTWMTWSWTNTERWNIQKYLLLPMSGYRDNTTWNYLAQWISGFYWSSNVTWANWYSLFFTSTGIPFANSNRSFGLMVRCFKN